MRSELTFDRLFERRLVVVLSLSLFLTSLVDLDFGAGRGISLEQLLILSFLSLFSVWHASFIRFRSTPCPSSLAHKVSGMDSF